MSQPLAGSDASYHAPSSAFVSSGSCESSDYTAEDSDELLSEAAEAAANAVSENAEAVINLPWFTSGTEVVSLGSVIAVAERYHCRLDLFIPDGFEAIVEGRDGRKFVLKTVSKTGNQRAWFQATEQSDPANSCLAKSATAACKITVPAGTNFSGPGVFGFKCNFVQQAIRAMYPPGAHELATQLTTVVMKRKWQRQRKQKWVAGKRPATRQTQHAEKRRRQTHRDSTLGRKKPTTRFENQEPPQQMAGPSNAPLDLASVKDKILLCVQKMPQTLAEKMASAEAQRQESVLQELLNNKRTSTAEVQAILGIDDRIAEKQAALPEVKAVSPAFVLHCHIASILDDCVQQEVA